MAKALKTVGAVVAIAGLAIVTGGAAVGLGVSLATSIGGISAGTLLLAGGALQAIGTSMQKMPDVPASQVDRLNATVDVSAYRKTVLGSTALASDIRYLEWFGNDQERCGWIVAHASHRIHSVDQIWLNDELAWTATGGTQGKFIGYFWVRRVVLEGSAANAFTFGSGKWNSCSSRLTGCAYSHWEFKVTGNGKKAESPFASGIPTRVTVVGKGAPLYDPRRDSTVPGGSGPMRADDQSTWRFVADDGAVIGDNLALQVLRVLLGWKINGRLAVGCGVPVRRLGLPSFAVAANQCDEPVGRSAGGTEPRYQGAAVLSEGLDPRDMLDPLLAACSARFRDHGGKLQIAIMHNDLAAAATDEGLDEDDVIGAFTWDPDPALEQTPNIIRGRYTDPASLYQLVPYPDVSLPSFDGIDRVLTMDLGVVESASQAQRVIKQFLQRKQYARRFSAPFDITAWRYNVGDVVPVTFAPLSFERKLFRVVETDPGSNPCQMVLEEENAAIYAWDNDDRAPVVPAVPTIYDASNNPLILAIGEAAETALWSGVTGPGKPQDKATVGAPDGTPVGNRLAEEINRLTDLNGENILNQTLRGDALTALIDARTMLDGKQVGVVIGEVRAASEAANNVFVQNFAFMGARNGEDNGWIFNADSIEIAGTGFTSRSLTALTAEVDGQKADITNMQEILFDQSGATLRSVNILDLDGNITGTVNTLSGEIGEYVIYANVFRIVNPNGGQPFTPFQIGADGTVEMLSVRVGTFAASSVTTETLDLFAIGKDYAVELGSNFTNIYGSDVTVMAINVVKDTDESGVQVDAQLRMRAVEWTGYFTVTYQPQGGAEIVMDTLWFWPGVKLEVNGVNSLRLPVAYMRRFQGIAAGAGTWRLKISFNGGNSSGGWIEAGSGFFIEEKKR
ncbi:phage tail protein [Sphingomonas sp. IW22]|uniref:phage tail protein n=1 Tax=Sphingomonas sp. IW22 TaxID=3242489 RepID=UPI00352001FD